MEFLFWICVFAILHSYLFFPLSLRLIAIVRKREIRHYTEKEPGLPFISLLMSVYNEEAVIIEKLNSILNSSYPPEKLEIIIGSDNSTDKTNALIHTFAAKFEHLTFLEFEKRQGKPNVINQLVEKAKGEVLLLTDANVIFSEKTLFELAKYFKDDSIGLVDANMVNKGMQKDGISYQEKAYISREVSIKNLEGKIWGAMMGPFGGCFAIRKSLYSKVPPNYLVDDFYINMKILEKKYSSINNTSAVVFEDVSNDLKEEFRRKVRIATGNFQNLLTFFKLIFKGNGVGYCFFSHKVLRWFGPFFILLTLSASYLLGRQSDFYLLVFYLQMMMIVIPFIDYLLRKIGIHILILRFITHFYSMNLALLVGFFKFLKGVKSNVWQPTRRNQ